MKTYMEMNADALNKAYDNSSAVKNNSAILERFKRLGEIVRQDFSHETIKYGDKETQTIDYFHIKSKAPLLVFIHGEYWNSIPKESFHFLVNALNFLQINAAFVGYTSVPENTIAGIESEIRQAIRLLSLKSRKLKFNKEKIILSGWSAGGHLCCECADEDGVVAVCPVSGIFDLEPIRLCRINENLSLSDSDVRKFSPVRKMPVSKPHAVVYGARELPEIARQSREFHEFRKNLNTDSSLYKIKARNHFNILESFESYDGEGIAALRELLKKID